MLIDAEDLPSISLRGKVSVGPKGYAHFTTHQSNREFLLHRYLLAPKDGKLPTDICVDHKNRNTLDNRKENLRLATPAENYQNSELPREGPRSGQTGVYRLPSGKWEVRLSKNGNRQNFGCYSDLESAKAVARMVIADREAELHAQIDQLSEQQEAA